MTQKSIKQLEIELWEAADELRANSKLTAAEYKDPLLGLILLRLLKINMKKPRIIWQKLYPLIHEPNKDGKLQKMILRKLVQCSCLKKHNTIT